MAQTSYTPISLYYSSTTTNVPTAGNLVAGELAINTADGKLFYKDAAGVVQVIAGKGGAGVAGGSNTQVQYNSSGSLAGSANLTFDGTTLNANILTSKSGTFSNSLSGFAATDQSVNGGYKIRNFANSAYATVAYLDNNDVLVLRGGKATSGISLRDFANTKEILLSSDVGVSVTNTVGVGGATPSASGAGITFPATQSASSDANTLDDYEEGTWTPTVSFAMASVGLTYASRSGIYTKIGRVVNFQLQISLSNKGSSTGYITIGNLPFSGNSVRSNSSVYMDTGLPTTTQIIGTDIYIYKANITSFTNLDSGDVTNSNSFTIAGSYQI